MGVAGGEGLADTAEGDTHFCSDTVGIGGQHLSVVTPGQKFGVFIDLGDQRIHFGRAVPDQNGLIDSFH